MPKNSKTILRILIDTDLLKYEFGGLLVESVYNKNKSNKIISDLDDASMLYDELKFYSFISLRKEIANIIDKKNIYNDTSFVLTYNHEMLKLDPISFQIDYYPYEHKKKKNVFRFSTILKGFNNSYIERFNQLKDFLLNKEYGKHLLLIDYQQVPDEYSIFLSEPINMERVIYLKKITKNLKLTDY